MKSAEADFQLRDFECRARFRQKISNSPNDAAESSLFPLFYNDMGLDPGPCFGRFERTIRAEVDLPPVGNVG